MIKYLLACTHLVIAFYETQSDWYAYVNAIHEATFPFESSIGYLAYAETLLEKSDDAAILRQGLEWLEKSAEASLQSESIPYGEYLVSARILQKMGDKSGAKEAIIRCIQCAEEAGLTPADYEDALSLKKEIDGM